MKHKSPTVLPSSNKLNPTQRKSIGAGVYTGPRERHPNEALPRDFIESKVGTFPRMDSVRPGADDFLKVKQVGVHC